MANQRIPWSGVLLRRTAGDFLNRLDSLGLSSHTIQMAIPGSEGSIFRLSDEFARTMTPDFDTIHLCDRLGFDPVGNHDDIEREIVLALLASPVGFEYQSYDELASSVRVRKNIVAAARQTELAFDTTDAAERPEDDWSHTKEQGFTVVPGHSLIQALRKATQPDVSGNLYAFSCYRATEYIIVLAVAEELAAYNPALLARLQRQWEIRAIKSGEFHEVFLVEYGSMEAPLPTQYYIPGDRVWFRNPDEVSSDIAGYEGSWVFYLGGGLFTNFWKHKQTYTLTSKCLEIYHWRHGAYRDADGNLQMNESIVEERVQASISNPEETKAILQLMMRLREPGGVYISGGSIDVSREYPRSVCLGHELMLSDT